MLTIISSLSVSGGNNTVTDNTINDAQKQQLFSYLNNMPVAFRKNVGQWDSKILYKGHTRGWEAGVAFLQNEISFRFLQENDASLPALTNGPKTNASGLKALIWNIGFKNSNPNVSIDGGTGTPSIYNYIRKSGNYLNVPDHSFVKYQNLYNNIDLAYYLDGDKLKHDFAVHPNGNISDIQLECKGVNDISVNRNGELEINTPWGILIEEMPESYQIIEGNKVQVNISYHVIDNHTYGFKINGNYSKQHAIIIDPIVMDWCTFLTTKTKAIQGGNNYAHGIDVDDAGFAYVTGFINEDFDPTPGAYDGTTPGPTPATTLGNDVFVVKMNLAGTAFVYATYVGGTDGADRGHDIRVKNGLAHVTGMSESSNFPTTAGCYDASWNGNGDAFAIKLNATGTALLYSTLYGGNGVDNPYGIDVDGGGNMYITGNTWSNNLPTKSAYDATFNAGFCDAFAAKINPAGTGANDLIYSTYIGGNGYDRGTECAVNAAGELHFTGTTTSTNFPLQSAAFGAYSGGNHDAFVTKLNATGTGLIFSTYLGGSGDEYIIPINAANGSSYGAEYGGIAVASTGDVFVVGSSGSANFPVTAGAYSTTLTGVMDVFVAKFTAAGALSNATFIGAPGYENRGYGIDLNSNNEPFVSGFTFGGFPTTACSFDPSFNSAIAYQSDFFLAKFSNNLGSLIYSTYIGGSEFDYNSPKIALIDKECYEDVYMCGTVHSKTGFPTTAGSYQPVHQYNNGADEPAAWKFKPEIDVDYTTSAVIECNTPVNFFGTATGNCIWQNGAWTASAWEWNFGDGSTASIQNPTHTYAAPGTYTVVLKVECPVDSIIKTIVVLPNATCACNVTVSATPTNATCGNANGSASTTTTGTTGTVTYTWSTTPVQTTATATGLNTGTYTVSITDGDGCTATTTLNITNTVPPTGTTTPTPVTCFGGTNGSAIVNPTGAGPFTYSWTAAAQTTQTATGLANGTYSVTITDVNLCTVVVPVTITQPTAVNATTTPSPVLCFGGNTGSASVSASGGTPGYSYSWSTTPSQSTVNATGLSATTYSVRVTDANGCTFNTTVVITQPTDITLTTSTVNPNCGASDGSATVTANGGTPNYTYSWNTTPSQSTITATGLASGFYSITVTDANGCTENTTVTLSTSAIPVLAEVHTDVTCFGGTNGTATITPSLGTTPYSYTWSGSAAGNTTANATGLTNGTYTVIVNDAAGCANNITVTLTAPPDIIASTTPTDVTCFGDNNGSATVTSSGGTGTHSYSWNTTPSQSTVNATGLTAGTYSVQTTDANGCTEVTTVTINQPTAVNATTTPTPTLCNGSSDGSATVSATGGTGAYTYSWNTIPSQTTTNATGLAAGTYSVQVTDANGCTFVTTVVITEPTPITLTTTTTNPNCGASDGDATITANGGTPGYTYSWDNGQTTVTATGLAAGFYTITVTDANNCTENTTVTLTGNNTPTLSEIHTPVTCFGGNDGTADVTASAGTPPYNYTWSGTAAGNVTNTATNLIAGTYTIIVSDQMGCANQISVSITQPTDITFSTTQVDVLCFGGNNGSATATSSGGTGTHTYSWSTTPSQTNATATGLIAGTYSVLITDANGCTKTTSVTITEPPQLTVTANNTAPLCNLGTDGTLSAVAGGGTPTYTYSWTGTVCSAANCNNVAAGTYTITVTDANGCTAANTTVVTEPTPIVLTTSANDAHCMQPDGDATVNATGGTGAYTYSWIITPSQATATATGLVPTTYSVVVTDANGCSTQTTVVVGNITGVVASILNSTNATCAGACDGTATADATGLLPPFTYSWNTTPAQTTAAATGLCAGTHSVTVTDNSGCQDVTSVTITEPTPVTLTVNPDQLICIGQSATLTATAAGGTPAYTITWNPGTTGTTQSVTPTANTTYTATVTDANGCTAAPAATTVNLNPPLSIVATGSTTYCEGSGGSATLSATASGGNGNYTYSWAAPINATGATQTVAPTVAGTYTYTVTVNDDCGTPPASTTVTVTVAPAPIVSFTGSDTTGCVPVCVKFTNNTPNSASCSWTLGDGYTTNDCNPAYCYKTVGVYSVSLTVVDANGCSATSTHTDMIHVWPYPDADFTFDPDPATVLEPTVYFNDQSAPGLGATLTNWAWDFGDNTSSTTQDPSHYFETENGGVFNVSLVVTNNYGCTDSIIKPITIKPDWTFYVPNTFTPNGDGHNDYFAGKGTGILEYEMWIYDRWGNEIYHCTDMNDPWDGKVQNGPSGEIAQIDTYVWLILIKDIFEKKHRYIGHVNIVK